LDIPTPSYGENDVLIKVSVCGVCHTDLHIVEGDLDLPGLPIVPGHQIVGTIEAIGARVTRYKIGDRVGVPWLNRTCGQCRYCGLGLENICTEARFTGFHENGGFAEYFVINENFAYPIPDSFPDLEAAPLLCAGIIGYRALKLSEIKPGWNLGLYGFGASAHVSIQVARYWGCRVYVFSRTESHLALARELGAEWTGHSDEDPPVKLQGSVIFAPAGEIVPLALEHLDRGGVVALAGIWMSEIPRLDYESHLYYEKTLRSVTASTRHDGKELLEVAAKIPIHTDVQVFALEEANEALEQIKHSKLAHGAAVLKIKED